MNILRKNKSIFWMVWSLVATSLLMVVILTGLIGWRLNSIRMERLQLERQQDDTDRASQAALRRAAEVRRDILKTLDVKIAAQSSAEANATASEVHDSENTPAPASGLSVSDALDRIKTLTARMTATEQHSLDWRQRYEPYWQDVAQQRALGLVHGLVVELQRKVELFQDQRRRQNGTQFKRWQEAEGEAAAQLARNILLEEMAGRDRVLSEFKNDLTKLAQAAEQIGHEERPEVLVELKDRQLKPAFDRLGEELANFPDAPPGSEYSRAALARDLEGLKVAIFGQEYAIDKKSQTLRAAAGGLYMKRHDIQLLKLEYENLKHEQSAIAHEIDLAATAYAQAVQVRSETMAGQMQNALAASWRQMLAIGAGCSAFFLWLAWRIFREIRRQVAALQRAESEAESGRQEAQRLLLEQQAAAKELKQMAETLQDSQAFLHSLLENLPVHIYRKDAEGRYIFANKNWCERKGRLQSEILGKTDFDFSPRELAEEYRRSDVEVMETGRMFESEHIQLKPDGEKSWIHINKVAITGKDGRVAGTQGIYWDVTKRKLAEEQLEQASHQLLAVSRQAGMAEVATSVLHNVGNVLNSVNVSATLVTDHVRQSKAVNLAKVSVLFDQHKADLAAFITTDPKGQMIPAYLRTLAENLAEERKTVAAELENLRKNIEHIKEIVAMQQSYAKTSGFNETVSIPDLVEDALRMNAGSLARHDVDIVRDYQARPVVTLDKHKVMQILVNLIRNAKYACDESGRTDKQITVRATADDHGVRIAVIDNGVGIPAENLTRIFNHGFTTRTHGHGFGLHSGALAAKELGGALTVQSDGPGKGAAFILELPYKPKT